MKTGLIFGVLFVALLATAVVIIELVRVPNMYAVEGQGSIKYRPESARISVGTVGRADVASDASIQASNGMNKILAALKGAGVSDSEITSSQIETGPTSQAYNASTGAPRLPNFAAVQMVEIELHDLKRLPTVLNTVTGAGASYSHVDFFVADELSLKRKARSAALADAIERADAYVGNGGFSRGRILKIQEGQTVFPYVDYTSRSFITSLQDGSVTLAMPPPPEEAPRFRPREAPAPLANYAVPQPQEATVDATVNVLFEIK